MHTKTPAILTVILTLLFASAIISVAQAVDTDKALSERQQAIVPIAAFTASGDMEALEAALNEGLDAGLSVNEIKEILVQMYAYAGFPRSLNGIFALMSVLDEREARGIVDEVGKDASPIPEGLDRDEYGAKVRATLAGVDDIPPPAAWQRFSPTIDAFLKQHLFADIFARDVLDFQSRELATIAALANLHGTAGQLRFHFGAAMNTGLGEAQMQAFIAVLEAKVGKQQADDAAGVLAEVLDKRS